MLNNPFKRCPPTVLIVAAVLVLCGVASACPSCGDSVANTVKAGGIDGQAGGNISAGFNNSIYLMLGGFLAVLGIVARVIVKGIRGSAA